MNRLEAVLVQLEADLREVGARWALVGGLAVSVRAEPRTTQDIDIGVAVGDDAEAEKLIRDLGDRGYELDMHLEQEAAGRLASVRVLPPPDDESTADVVVDILFASSGIEQEIVAEADPVEVFPGVVVPVAQAGHLLALKALAGRMQDLADAQSLLTKVGKGELARARDAVGLIEARGFARGKDLTAELAHILESGSP